MFAGKTEGLIDRVKGAEQKGWTFKVYKPVIDTRHPGSNVLSHAGRSVEASWTSLDLDAVEPFQLVAIDEAQFLTVKAIEVVRSLVAKGSHVVLAGLDLDSFAEPFGPMPIFQGLAHEVVQLSARCTPCGSPARRTFRKSSSEAKVLVGGADSYEPRCLPCWATG